MDDKIIIPYGLTMEQEYFPGFGSRELRQFLIGGAASAVLGALLLIFSGQLLALIVCIMIGASGSGTVLTNGLARISTTGAQLDISRRCMSCRDIPKK